MDHAWGHNTLGVPYNDSWLLNHKWDWDWDWHWQPHQSQWIDWLFCQSPIPWLGLVQSLHFMVMGLPWICTKSLVSPRSRYSLMDISLKSRNPTTIMLTRPRLTRIMLSCMVMASIMYQMPLVWWSVDFSKPGFWWSHILDGLYSVMWREQRWKVTSRRLNWSSIDLFVDPAVTHQRGVRWSQKPWGVAQYHDLSVCLATGALVLWISFIWLVLTVLHAI